MGCDKHDRYCLATDQTVFLVNYDYLVFVPQVCAYAPAAREVLWNWEAL